MSPKTLLIVYHTETGNTKLMADLIGEAARKLGVNVRIKRADDCRIEELASGDGLVLGSPTYFSNVSWQMKKLIDESIVLYRADHQLKDKIGGCFTSAGTERDAKDCVKIMELTLGLHHRMKVVPGIYMTPQDQWNDVIKRCEIYGEEIAKNMTA